MNASEPTDEAPLAKIGHIRTKEQHGLWDNSSFTPAMSKKSAKKIKEAMKSWNLHNKLQWHVNQIAEEINPQVRGWYNYYTKFGRTEFWYVMKHLNDKLVRWVIRKYKEFKKHPKKANAWLEILSRRERGMFAHWSLGHLPQCAK